jgi:hypothetical protein
MSLSLLARRVPLWSLSHHQLVAPLRLHKRFISASTPTSAASPADSGYLYIGPANQNIKNIKRVASATFFAFSVLYVVGMSRELCLCATPRLTLRCECASAIVEFTQVPYLSARVQRRDGYLWSRLPCLVFCHWNYFLQCPARLVASLHSRLCDQFETASEYVICQCGVSVSVTRMTVKELDSPFIMISVWWWRSRGSFCVALLTGHPGKPAVWLAETFGVMGGVQTMEIDTTALSPAPSKYFQFAHNGIQYFVLYELFQGTLQPCCGRRRRGELWRQLGGSSRWAQEMSTQH